MLITFLKTVSESSDKNIALPRDFDIFAFPSRPISRGADERSPSTGSKNDV